jgi:hypothetical protein
MARPMHAPMTGGSDCGPNETSAVNPDTGVLYQLV